MDVIVDGERNYEFKGEPKDVLSALAAVDQLLQERGRVMLSVSLDGEAVTPEELPGRLDGTPLDAVGVLEVRSSAVADLVREELRGLEESLPELPVACRKLAEVFHGETPEEGFEPFDELANIWSHVKAQQVRIATALKLDLAGFEVGGRPIATHHEELNAFLEEAVQALHDGDCVLLGDLLEYELAPRAEQELALVELLKSEADTAYGRA